MYFYSKLQPIILKISSFGDTHTRHLNIIDINEPILHGTGKSRKTLKNQGGDNIISKYNKDIGTNYILYAVIIWFFDTN